MIVCFNFKSHLYNYLEVLTQKSLLIFCIISKGQIQKSLQLTFKFHQNIFYYIHNYTMQQRTSTHLCSVTISTLQKLCSVMTNLTTHRTSLCDSHVTPTCLMGLLPVFQVEQ